MSIVMNKLIRDNAPALYVGTYAKYNNGDLSGDWIQLTSDKEEFYKSCAELHKDEKDPEFMFQDAEYIPEILYSECGISAELIDKCNNL